MSAPQALASAARRGVVGRPRRLGEEALAGLGGPYVELDPERPQLLEVADEGGLRLCRILRGVEAHAHLRARGGHDRVHGPVDRQHVDAGHGERGARPEALAEPARADERHALLDLRELAELLVAERRSGPLLASEPFDDDVAVLVVHRRERAEHGEERIGSRSAELARVLRAGERPHLDGDDAPSRAGRS